MMSEAHTDWPVVAIDLTNAHNEVSRASVVEGFKSVQTLQHLALHIAAYLASHHRLESSGEQWGEAGEGHAQGDPEASAAFAVAVHPAVVWLKRELSVVGGLAIFGNDDGFAVGPGRFSSELCIGLLPGSSKCATSSCLHPRQKSTSILVKSQWRPQKICPELVWRWGSSGWQASSAMG